MGPAAGLIGHMRRDKKMHETILETARLLGYRHNVIAADLATKTRSTIGLYLLDFRNEVYADVFRGAE